MASVVLAKAQVATPPATLTARLPTCCCQPHRSSARSASAFSSRSAAASRACCCSGLSPGTARIGSAPWSPGSGRRYKSASPIADLAATTMPVTRASWLPAATPSAAPPTSPRVFADAQPYCQSRLCRRWSSSRCSMKPSRASRSGASCAAGRVCTSSRRFRSRAPSTAGWARAPPSRASVAATTAPPSRDTLATAVIAGVPDSDRLSRTGSGRSAPNKRLAGRPVLRPGQRPDPSEASPSEPVAEQQGADALVLGAPVIDDRAVRRVPEQTLEAPQPGQRPVLTQSVGQRGRERDVLEAAVRVVGVQARALRIARGHAEEVLHVVAARVRPRGGRLEQQAVRHRRAEAEAGREGVAVAVQRVGEPVELQGRVLPQAGEEVVADRAADHQRLLGAADVLDLVVLDVVIVLDEVRREAQPPVLARDEVGAERGADEADVGLGVVEVAEAQAPERGGLVVVRALVVRQVRGAEPEGDLEAGLGVRELGLDRRLDLGRQLRLLGGGEPGQAAQAEAGKAGEGTTDQHHELITFRRAHLGLLHQIGVEEIPPPLNGKVYHPSV